MFKKILVANRGEIACRIMRTAKRMGIATVAVYSDADRDALHVRMADEAVRIGPAPVSQSYLAARGIVEAARAAGAEAVHPGYGFLSENAAFARSLKRAGLAFVGPGARAIKAMGDKIESKRLAEKAGVRTVPGRLEAVADGEAAVRIAREIGYPVMLKASAGGGGKGMRVAYDDAECREGLERARSEARTSFGDDRVFIEKCIVEPRHIEIQVLADSHGNTVHLNERECSIQRRHQKVIEEAPSPFVDAAMRAAMGAQAVALARAVGYVSAGTVEFIVDQRRTFYFLEMNTRLQVEHPVTEMVTGLDLVELMIRIAAGERLPFGQEDVRLDGWAIEGRIYAEDPVRNFLPSTGRLVRYRPPAEERAVRVDTGVFEGGEISIHYDPMIAKLITAGPDRAEASAAMRDALDAFVIRGVRHNIGFLAAVLSRPRFVEGRLSTAFIGEEFPGGFRPADLPHDDPELLVAVAAVLDRIDACGGPWVEPENAGDDRVVVLQGRAEPVSVRPADGGFEVTIRGRPRPVRTSWRPGEVLFRAEVAGRSVCVQVERPTVGWRIAHAGVEAEALVLTPRAAELHALMPRKTATGAAKRVLSPMPGLLVSVAVAVGQEVKAGEPLAVVEAMKMENVLRAERDGVIGAVLARPGDALAVDQAIVEFA